MAFKKDALTDMDKPMFELYDPNFLRDQVKILNLGARKYGINNYKKANIKQQQLYIGAIHRHLNDWQRGYKFDISVITRL